MIGRIVEKSVDALAWLALIFIGAAALVTGVDVVMRHTLGGGVRGMVDLTQLAVMYSVFLSIAYGFARRAHVAVTVLTEMFSERVNTALALLWWLVAVVVMAVLAYAAFGQARLIAGYGDVSQNIRIPMIWYWLPVVVGLALSALASLWAAIVTLKQGAGSGSGESA
ncbi:MAG: TRAP transporter small permease [Rhodobacter sp.]|nr:TRAP transporter small permease [Paracoccaceae bacterium]MCC0076291.1 TRAP transporter small permease [Rhodobacter sp.]